MSDNLDLQNIKNKLDAKFRNISIHDVVDNNDGSVSLVLSGGAENLSSALKVAGSGEYRSLPVIDIEDIRKLKSVRTENASAATVRRDVLGSDYLDLSKKPSVLSAKPQELYKRAMEYHKTQDIYGTTIDLMANFASKGMKNDIDDENIRNFYDNWVLDTGFDVIVEQIFMEFFRSGFVRTYKTVGKYEPKINYISPIPGERVKRVKDDVASLFVQQHKDRLEKLQKEEGAKKRKWSKDYLPIKYTILNPTQVEVDKCSFLMDQQLLTLKAEALVNVKDLLETAQSELTEYQKHLLSCIPSDMKAAALAGKDLPLDPYLVGAVDYRRMPYELYPYPRGVRAFESIEYKKALREADYSTLDGITNFILVVTIGNDAYPVKTQAQLEAVADLFNTPSKAFNVVWDHTLKVQRIEPSDIGAILGQDKYRQVNEDLTGAFGVVRALLDGSGSASKSASDLAIKALREEIAYARTQVARWVYSEYRDVAEAMGFDRYPKVRFDNMILKDEILMMNVIQGMIDRRIISYRTGHEMLGFDFDTLLSEMVFERDLVLDGSLGIIGSPYNPKALSPDTTQVQDVQRTPKGTPSEGRPKGKPAKTPNPPTKPDKNKPEESASGESAFISMLNGLSVEELGEILQITRGVVIKKLANGEEDQ